MDIGKAFKTLEVLLPNEEAKAAFDHVRRKINSAAGAEDLDALKKKVADISSTVSDNANASGDAFRHLTKYLENPTEQNKDEFIKFIQGR